jgi:UDP-N-acetylglucosamine--N-acetylmuramyl-(pentapeptide) pyrophosphoryl-undecaprenol N-acetylglucosamine transferase
MSTPADTSLIAFCGGGTGGHIYPGLAVAEELKKLAGPDLRICWIGSTLPRDRTMVEGSKTVDAFYPIMAGKLRRYFSWQTFADAFKVAIACVQSVFLLARLRPQALFSKGGYVSVPPCFAAHLLGILVFAHEADFSPGLATRLTAKKAARLFVSYPETAKFFGDAMQSRIVVSGNPIRPAMYHGDRDKGRRFLGVTSTEQPLLLVLGGSLGARQINTLIKENLEWLTERFIVVHQTGIDTAPVAARANYHPYAFFRDEIADVIAAADAALTRAGASALWECAVAGKAMALLPLGLAGSRGDQLENARHFAGQGAAVVLESAKDSDMGEELRRALEGLTDRETRQNMGDAAKRICAGKPAETIARTMWEALQ